MFPRLCRDFYPVFLWVASCKSTSSNTFEIASKLVKSWPCCKSVGQSVFCDPCFLVIVVGKMVKAPPTPQAESDSAHLCLPYFAGEWYGGLVWLFEKYRQMLFHRIYPSKNFYHKYPISSIISANFVHLFISLFDIHLTSTAQQCSLISTFNIRTYLKLLSQYLQKSTAKLFATCCWHFPTKYSRSIKRSKSKKDK